MYSWFGCFYGWSTTSSTFNLSKDVNGGTYSPHPLLGNPCFLHSPQRVHEPAPVARMLRWDLADVKHCRAVGPCCQTQHLHQATNRLVGYSAAVPRRQGFYCPVGVTLDAVETIECRTLWWIGSQHTLCSVEWLMQTWKTFCTFYVKYIQLYKLYLAL